MALQFIFGRAHSGKTQYILDRAYELYNEEKPIIIVVPEQFTHLAEKRVLSKIGSIRQNICEVLSFDRIAKKINSAFPSPKKTLSAVGQSLIISELLANIDYKYYKSAHETAGFCDVCLEEISEFKKYLISPEMILEASKKTDNVALSLKLQDLYSIYIAYENSINEKFNDSDDTLNILRENLDNYRPYKGVTFLFDEFSSFNPQERSIISSIASQAENVYISLCGDPSPLYTQLFRPTLETARLIKEECMLSGCKCEKDIILKNSFYANHELCHLEKYLYVNPIKKFEKTCPGITVSSFENPYSEVETLAKSITNLIRTQNVRYRDIGIVCSDMDAYGFIIKSVFDIYEIPYFIDEKAPVLDHSIVSFVINILDVYINSYSAETVVNFLKSGCVEVDREAVYTAENYILATSASKNTWLSDEKWNKSIEKFCGDNKLKLSYLNEVRNKFVLRLASFHDTIKGRHTVKFITQKLYEFLIESDFDKSISEYIRLFKSENNIYMAKQYEKVWKTLIDAFDELVYILGDKTVNVTEYRKHLSTALGQQKTGVIPTSLDEIIVGDVKRSKSEFVDYQFVLGVNDSLFPASSNADSALTDEEKDHLTSFGVRLSFGMSEKAYFDRFLEYSILTHPQKQLAVSYSYSDADFSALRPAFIITVIKNIFTNVSQLTKDKNDFEFTSLTKSRAKEILSEAISCVQRGEKYVDESWKDIYQYFSKSDADYDFSDIEKFVKNQGHILKIDSSLTDIMFNDEFYSTISRIQKYNSCRYAYYLEYMLRLKEKDLFGIKGTDIGTVVHEIIERLFEDIKQKNIPLETTNESYFLKESERMLCEYTDAMREISGELSAKELYSVSRLKTSLVRSIMAIRDHIINSKFVPLGHEIVFDNDNIGCIDIVLDNGKTLKITGKIDRADYFTNEDGTYIRVIDYKTGNKTFSFTDMFYGLDVQLLVYMNALVSKTENAYPAGALYFKIQNPVKSYDSHPDEEEIGEKMISLSKMDGVVSDNPKVLEAYSPGSFSSRNKLSHTQFKMLGEYMNSVIKNSAQSLCEGYIDINPYSKSGDDNSCMFCPYESICNFQNCDSLSYRKLSPVKSSSAAFEKISEKIDKEGK